MIYDYIHFIMNINSRSWRPVRNEGVKQQRQRENRADRRETQSVGEVGGNTGGRGVLDHGTRRKR